MISGMIESAKKSRLKGVLVRSFIHARRVPTRNANTAEPAAYFIELKNSLRVSRLE